MLTIKDLEFVPYITADALQDRISELALRIMDDYKDREIVFIVVLNGAFMFAADLLKQIKGNHRVSFVKISSYEGLTSSGSMDFVLGLAEDVQGKNIIVIEDIVDTGKTLTAFMREIGARSPASAKIATLLSKPEARTCPIEPDYVAFSIENRFVVGYGLDYDGLGRNLPEIYQLAP